MSDDDARQRAAGLMHGLTDLKREWKPKKQESKRGVKRRRLPTPKATTPKGATAKKP
jgi:hypothetical protein